MLFFSAVFLIILILNIAFTLVPRLRPCISRHDPLGLVSSWAFFAGSRESLVRDVVAERGGDPQDQSLTEIKFLVLPPFYDPWRRYWKIVADHAVLGQLGADGREGHLQELREIAKLVTGVHHEPFRIEIRFVGESDAKLEEG